MFVGEDVLRRVSGRGRGGEQEQECQARERSHWSLRRSGSGCVPRTLLYDFRLGAEAEAGDEGVPGGKGQDAAGRLVVAVAVLGAGVRRGVPAQEVEQVVATGRAHAETYPARQVTAVGADDDELRQPGAPNLGDER